jgi:hypothetical protein
MPSRTLDAEIDRLYQLPLDEFTAARNALAKQAGQDGTPIRALAKPPIAAWAVNQLHWRDRGTWKALIEAADNARRAHHAVLAGKATDVRSANEVHEEAVEKALKATLALLGQAGHPVTDATRQAISTTIRALPGQDPPGRLTRTLQPGGFEMLSGLTITKVTKDAKEPKETKDAKDAKGTRDQTARERQAEIAAARDLREAESAARRADFEKARTERDVTRATDAVGKAREGVNRAEALLEESERELRAAENARDGAAAHARKAHEAFARARKR